MTRSEGPEPSRRRVLAAFAAIYFFWGATFLAVRIAVVVVPPLITISVRCIGGALILWMWLDDRLGRASALKRVSDSRSGDRRGSSACFCS